MKDSVNWGIAATGGIAHSGARALSYLQQKNPSVKLMGVASRTLENAETFAKEFSIPYAYSSYEEMFADPKIDAVYIASPHTFHAELSAKALLAGKHVLCEKPAAINSSELQAIINLAEEKNLFFMEAFWTSFNPTINLLLEKLSQGLIGNITHSYSVFNNRCHYDAENRFFSPKLAGGALLDLGIYSLTFSMMIAQAAQNNLTPAKKSGNLLEARKGTTSARISNGVDLWNSTTLTFASGFAAVAESGIDFHHPNNSHDAYIYGTKGYVKVNSFFMSESAEVYIYKDEWDNAGEKSETISVPFECNGYEYEFLASTEAIMAGKTECEKHTWQDSLAVCKIMDSLRAQWHFEYPFEKKNYADLCALINSAANNGEKHNAENNSPAEKNPSDENTPLIIYTDGGCHGNPGPGGWGCVLIDGQKELRLNGGEKNTTNNRMELMAAIQALSSAAQKSEWKKRKICVYSDSQYVKNGITSWIKNWKQNGWKTAGKKPVLNRELWEELDELYSALNVEWQWVKGHAGNKYNEICDQLCQSAMSEL